MNRKKRAITTALCLLAALLLVFLIWADNAFGRYSLYGSGVPAERTLRQLMLEGAEEIYRGEDGFLIYDAGEYMLTLQNGNQNYSLCEFENGAAVLAGNRSIGFFTSTVTEIELPLYSLHRHSGAERAELEIYVSRTVSPYGSGEHQELHCVLPSESCADGLSIFNLRIKNPDSHTVSLAEDFWRCLDRGSITNAVYYKMNLRFYDADGAIISESVFETGEKES